MTALCLLPDIAPCYSGLMVEKVHWRVTILKMLPLKTLSTGPHQHLMKEVQWSRVPVHHSPLVKYMSLFHACCAHSSSIEHLLHTHTHTPSYLDLILFNLPHGIVRDLHSAESACANKRDVKVIVCLYLFSICIWCHTCYNARHTWLLLMWNEKLLCTISHHVSSCSKFHASWVTPTC